MKKLNKAFLVVVIIYFFQGLIHNIGHPITPAFVRGLGIPDYMFGVFYASMSLGLVIGAPIWGMIADRGNKKNAMVGGLIIYSIGQFAFGYSNNVYWMVFFRLLSGIGVSASVTLFISHVAEISKPMERAKHLAWMAASLAIGRSIGYWIGGFMTTNASIINLLGTNQNQLERVFLIQALLNIIHALMIFVLIKESQQNLLTQKKSSMIDGFKNIKSINKTVLIFLISLIFISIAHTNLSKYLDVYFDELGYDTGFIGNYNLIMGIVGILTSIIIVPLIIKVNRNLLVMQIIQIVSIIAVLYVFRAPDFLFAIYSVFMIYIIGHAIFQPLEQNFIADQSKKGLYSTTMGLRQSFFSIGMVIGPLIGGVLFDLKPLYVFDFSVAMLLIGLILILVVQIRLKKENQSLSS